MSQVKPVDKHVCKVDLRKAEAPISKLGSDEYFRALENYKTLKKTPEEYLPEEVVYMIDKEIRLKFRREKESNWRNMGEKVMSCTQFETLKDTAEKTSFEQWVRKKNYEIRIKKNLTMQALKKKYENDLLEEQNREEMKSDKAKKLKQWETQKLHENAKKMLYERYFNTEAKKEKETKKRLAETQYKEWLKSNMIKLKEEKKLKKVMKAKELEEKRKKEEKEAELRQRTEENFKNWLRAKQKKPAQKPQIYSKTNKPAKPIMLAYSPNKKVKKPRSKVIEYMGPLNETPSSLNSNMEKVRRVSSKPKLYSDLNEFSEIDKGNKNVHSRSSEYSQSFDEASDYQDQGEESYEEEGDNSNNDESDYESSIGNKGNLSF